MNILIPMAGEGKRFKEHGYDNIKPLILVDGKPMIQRAIESLGIEGQFIFVIRADKEAEQIKELLNTITKNPIIIETEWVTEGPACSALLADDVIYGDEPLVIANCDQIMWWDHRAFSAYCENAPYDGIIVTYYANSSKNSYARLDRHGCVKEIREKEVISNISLNGIHYWQKGSTFVESALTMIKKNDKSVNGEFYIGPSYNHMINIGLEVGIFHVPNCQHHAIGTPEDLERYLSYASV